MNRPRGRPTREKAIPSRENMLGSALHLLESGGAEGFTMRALGQHLGVNPMTLYHHFGDRAGLIKALADQVYSSVSVPEAGEGLGRVEALLRAYHACVVRYPDLTLLIFSGPEVFPQQAQRITNDMTRFLIDLGLSQKKAALWVNILVDFTHGAAIATAVAARSDTDGVQPDAETTYAEGLMELLSAMHGSQHPGLKDT